MSTQENRPSEQGGLPGRFGWRLRRRIERLHAAWAPERTELDETHIAAALLGNDADPRSKIASHHNHRFRENAGRSWPRFLALGTTIDETITERRSFVAALDKAIAKMPRRTILNERATDWSLFDYGSVGLCAAAAAALLYFSWRALGVILMQSGVIEDASDAGAFSIVPLGGAFVLKVVTGWMSEDGRKRYIGSLAVFAILGTALWSYLFAQTYGHGMSAKLPTLDAPKEEGSGTDLTTTLLTVGLLVESAIAALLWMAIDRVVHSHRATEPNKERVRTERLLHRVRDELLWLQTTAKPRNDEILKWHEHASAALTQRAQDRFDTLDGLRRNTALVLDLQHQRDAGPLRSPERGFRDRTLEDHNPNSNGNGAVDR